MEKEDIINRVLWPVGAMASLWVCYALWYVLNRHGILGRLDFTFGWPFLRGWPFNLLVLGLIVIFIAAFTYSRKVMVCVVMGYTVGSVLGLLLNTDGFDPGGGAANNAWIIWTVSYIVFIFAGAIWELVSKYAKKDA